MKIFLATFGSYGDVRPFLWMAGELMTAGHEVLLITNPTFRAAAEEAGVPFRPAGTEEDYQAAATPATRTGNPMKDQNEQIAAARRLFTRLFLNPTKETYDAITASLPGEAIVMGHFFAFGARLAAERHNLPFVNVCLAPHWLKGFAKPSGLKTRLQRFTANANTRFIDSQLFTAPMNALRTELGLAPLTKSSAEWMFGGNTLCLFPEWFLRFPLEDGMGAMFAGFPPAAQGDLPQEVEAFLQRYPNPIVFTAGTSIANGSAFFQAALDALRELGRPGILLTGATGAVPQGLPETVLHAGFAPLGSLLGRCAALVHHGGIGTAAAALEYGVPQLVCCRTEEQQENARVVAAIGAGGVLPWKKLDGKEMARQLAAITDSRTPASRAGMNPPPGYLKELVEKLRQN